MSQRGWRILLVCWMALIFLVSSRLLAGPASFESTELLFGRFNYLARKTAHIVEYAVLAYLWFRALWTRREALSTTLAWSVILSVLYGAVDEVHQSMVPGRLGTWTDVLFDAAGAVATGAVLLFLWHRGKGDLRRRLLGPLSDPPGDSDRAARSDSPRRTSYD